MFFVKAPFATRAAHFLCQRVELIGRHVVHIFVLRGRQRKHYDFAVPVLAAPTGLFNVLTLRLRLPANRFAIGDLRAPDGRLYAKLAHHAVNNDLQVQFAHPGNDGLSGVRIAVHAERRIFLRQLLHGVAELVLIGLGLGLDGDRNNGCRKYDVLENDRFRFIAQRVPCRHTLQSHARSDIARINGVDLFALVGVHAKQSPNALPRRLGGVVDIAAGLQNTGINTDVGNVPDERIGHNLERKRRKRLDVVGAPQLDFIIRRCALHRRNIERRR